MWSLFVRRSQIVGWKEEESKKKALFKLPQGNGQWKQARLERLSDGIYLK